MRPHLLPFVLLATTLAGVAVAQDGPKQISGEAQKVSDYRHNAFEGLGKHMKVSAMMVKGEVALTKADMVLHARAMNDTAKAIPGWFPEGTGPDKVKTDALATVWTDRAGFDKAAAEFGRTSEVLLEKAQAGDADGFKAAFQEVGKACGACHDTYRKDEDH